MILGLDVGGTQTDAVVLEDGHVRAHTKTVNRPELLETLGQSLDKTLAGIEPDKIQRMVFSTTMATNAVVMDNMDPAGMIVSAGPGMNPEWFSVGPSYHVVEGCMDHRGTEVMALDKSQVKEAIREMEKAGVNACGIVCKFSVRNPHQELQVEEWLGGQFGYKALGHRFSGSLNFPRRIATAYLNAALHKLHTKFISSLETTLTERGLNAPRYLMKPDGGTIRLDKSCEFPAQTAQSGPAASVMGALALDGCKGVTLVLDIGGTTTDMALVLDGLPLWVPNGIRIGEHRTSIRSLLTRSVGFGGDSEVKVEDGKKLSIGPMRRGEAMAFGGPMPTPTDAMITLGLMEEGDKDLARKAMEKIGAQLSLDAEKAAKIILEETTKGMTKAVIDFVKRINSRPVYTIHEVIEGIKIDPDRIVVLGAPAPIVAPMLEKAFNIPCVVPPHYQVANAVGAAAAKVTAEISLQADTQRGSMVIPEVGLESAIARDFTMAAAMEQAKEALFSRGLAVGADPGDQEFAVIEKEEFNMIRGGYRVGKNIRLKLALVPGLIPDCNCGGQQL
ncbi:Hydantoinase/oxoprolinase [Desulfatibacillum aliphaticivorans]|uniref:Hydantoinase/oxoprolinase n=1 Tax=Desulfatibacillum aliphaticivorans TaxID=218208 RepID=B8FL65_DESAL|nr:hydantoinase/oxoprolinase family protein [Desulfatibacillum aliphaticivorans]ACL04700.1 Hydantoinase/oxoprolinase [Desulfatibacillum aliphaticivorans]